MPEIDKIMTEEQIANLIMLLRRAMADGFGVVSIEVEHGRVEYVGIFQKFRTTDRNARSYQIGTIKQKSPG